jgi:hypothetical protein
MANAYQEVIEAIEKTRSTRKVANDLFFDSIEILLAETNNFQACSACAMRTDRWSYEIHKRGLRERHLDVVEMLEQLELSPAERASVDPIIMEFEPVFVASRRQSGLRLTSDVRSLSSKGWSWFDSI